MSQQIDALLKLLRNRAHYEFEARSKAADLIEKLQEELSAEKALVHYYKTLAQIASSPPTPLDTISRMQREMGERCPRTRGDDCVYPQCTCDRAP